MEDEEKQLILTTCKWIKVPRYRDDEALPTEERLKKLQENHVLETEFLIAKVRELVLLVK